MMPITDFKDPIICIGAGTVTLGLWAFDLGDYADLRRLIPRDNRVSLFLF